MSMTMTPRPSGAFRTDRTIEAAEAIEARGERVDYSSLSAEMGMRRGSTCTAVSRAKDDPRWRWEIFRRNPPELTPEARAERNRRIGESVRESHHYRATADDLAAIEAAKAEVQAEARERMIDGTKEVDDPPHGVPPRSNKDHAAWSRMQFRDLHHGLYEPRVHRAANLEGRSPR